MAAPNPRLWRAANKTIALLHAESIRKTDDLARAHGSQLLEYTELAFIGRVIGTAELGHEISTGDFEELGHLSARAMNSDYVAFEGIEQIQALLQLLEAADYIPGEAALAPKAKQVTPSAPRRAASDPVPDLQPIRHRARPSASNTQAAPAPQSAQLGRASTAERHITVRHRTRPVTLEAKKPLRPQDAC